MVFSSTIFLFHFLPLVLTGYLLVGRRGRNALLLLASLVFYAWGETLYVLIMLASITANYLFGLGIDRAKRSGRSGRPVLAVAVAANLGLLGFFKYANFVVDNLNAVLATAGTGPIELDAVHLPIGISFFTFQAMSYVIDLYRGEAEVQKNPVDIALYIALFPQLIAGPIVRYHDIARQIRERVSSLDDFSIGVQRFILGLGKKVLLANVLGEAADYLFSLPPERLPASLAWTGAIAYTLQIYYDFSGYSDMAIGLGRMFGFRFLENFNYPYISRSVREFWRRWHISLSTWFRDYLYFPLGGSRKSPARTYFNLFLVFFLCGLWHGASWTFVGWGLFHGAFLVAERTRPGKALLDALPSILRHGYVLLVVIVGWVFFRAESFPHAVGYLQAMLDWSRPSLYNSQIFLLLDREFHVALLVAILGCGPLFPWLERVMPGFRLGNGKQSGGVAELVGGMTGLAFMGFVFVYSLASIMGGAYNPFLYFRF